jgi:LPXTG-motif cell wall-anchored protein
VPPSSGTTPPTTAPASELPPPLHDPPNGEETLPQVEAEVIDPGDKVVDLGPLSPSELMTLEEELDHQQMAHTGSNDSNLALVGLAVLVAGSALAAFAARARGSG